MQLPWVNFLSLQCQRPLVRVLVITNTSKTTADKSNGHCQVWMDSLWVYNRLFYFRSNAAKPQFMAVIIPRSQDRPCFKVLGFVLAFIGKTHASVNLPKVIRNTQPLQNKKEPLGNPNKAKNQQTKLTRKVNIQNQFAGLCNDCKTKPETQTGKLGLIIHRTSLKKRN